MRTEGLISKVAICPKCGGMLMACHVDYLDRRAEKVFTDFTNQGFTVKLETREETQSRGFGYKHWQLCEPEKFKKKQK